MSYNTFDIACLNELELKLIVQLFGLYATFNLLFIESLDTAKLPETICNDGNILRDNNEAS
jgi:hypothetical protein